MPALPGSLAGVCPACGGRLRWWRQVSASEPLLGGQPFDLWRCGQCGSAVTGQRAPAGLHDSGAYGGGPPRLYRWASPVLARFDRRRLALLQRCLNAPAHLLDVGAGRGRFVLSARAAGFDASGIEPSERGVAGAQTLGAPVRRATLELAEVPPGSLDAVTLWHVLEHLEDPEAALDRIHGWLRPGGTLLLGVPNLDSLQARLGGPHWYHLDVPRHRVHFTLAGVRAVLERHGYEVLQVEHRLAEHNPFGMWQTLVNRLTRTPSYLYNLLKHNASPRSPDLAVSVLALSLLPMAVALEAIAARAQRGGTVAVLARALNAGE